MKKIWRSFEMNHQISRRWFLPLAAFLFLLSLTGRAASAEAPSAIATVQKANGVSTVVREGRPVPARIGLEIWENDTLRTGPDGSIGVVFNDETQLSLGPESNLVIDRFVFAPRKGKFSIVIRMLRGTAVYLSGLISKLAPQAARFETPSASIGMRGTKFAVKIGGR
jgi:hypothetical protein